jgi:hypothetical protein
MPRKKFVPPHYEESLRVLFDRATGEVLATEEYWSLVQANAVAESPAYSELLKSVARQSGKRDEDLDVLTLRGESEIRSSIQRIDVHSRKPISEEMAVAATHSASPSKIPAP